MDVILKWLLSPAVESVTVKWWMALAFAAVLLLCLFTILLIRNRGRKREVKPHDCRLCGESTENRLSTSEDYPGRTEDGGDSGDIGKTEDGRDGRDGKDGWDGGECRDSQDSQGMPFLEVANFQGIGQREEQQDAFGLSSLIEYEKQGLLAVLCDGMGGMVQGREIAQTLVSDILANFPYGDKEAVAGWSKKLEAASRDVHLRYQGTGGSTLVLTYLLDGGLWCFSTGDSDIFLLRDNRLYGVNHKHEYLNDLFGSVLEGRLSMKQALEDRQGNALSHFIGSLEFGCDFTRRPISLENGDTLLLCSDGISDTLSLQKIQNAMMLSPPKCCEELEGGIDTAAKANQDNYTGIVIRYNSNFTSSNCGGV